MPEPKWLASSTILRVLVGSEAYGISESSSDRDEMGVCIEPLEEAMGFSPFEQYEFRTATERTGKKDEPSAPGDLDLKIYSLKKFLKLALKGNPTIMELFFLRTHTGGNSLGEHLQEMAPYVVSKEAASAYLGYMQAQKRKLSDKVPVPGSERAELVKKFGFDTKYAGHLLRLGMQGIELMKTGRILFPMKPIDIVMIRAVREGHYPLKDVLESSSEMELTLRELQASSHLQDHPQTDKIETWMRERYWFWWSAQRRMLDLPYSSVVQ